MTGGPGPRGDAGGSSRELARETYQEVLDATKHQDDKINRFLVAIAFLTTGVITVALRTDVLRVHHGAAGWRAPLIAVAAGIYAACTVTAVVLLLLALSSELKVPGRKVQAPGREDSLAGSLLYFQYIGGRTVDQWLRAWDDEQHLESKLRTMYLKESHNLATRARVKYGLTDEAAAIYIYGLLWLGVMLALALHALQRPAGVSPLQVIPLAGWPIVLAGLAFGGHAFVQLHNVFRHERATADASARLAALSAVSRTHAQREPAEAAQPVASGPGKRSAVEDAADLGKQHRERLKPLLGLMLALPAYVGFSSLAGVGDEARKWPGAIAAAAIAAVARLLLRDRFGESGLWRDRALSVAAVGGMVLPAAACAGDRPVLAIAAAAGPATALSMSTAARQVLQLGASRTDLAARLARDAAEAPGDGLAARMFEPWRDPRS